MFGKQNYRIWWLVALFVFLSVLPFTLKFHQQDFMIFLLINVLVVVSYRLVTLTGEWSLIHVIITAFIVTIVGGIGSLFGAVLAAVLYAFFHTFVTTYFGGTAATLLGLVIMLIVLIIKPTGIMGQRTTE